MRVRKCAMCINVTACSGHVGGNGTRPSRAIGCMGEGDSRYRRWAVCISAEGDKPVTGMWVVGGQQGRRGRQALWQVDRA